MPEPIRSMPITSLATEEARKCVAETMERMRPTIEDAKKIFEECGRRVAPALKDFERLKKSLEPTLKITEGVQKLVNKSFEYTRPFQEIYEQFQASMAPPDYSFINDWVFRPQPIHYIPPPPEIDEDRIADKVTRGVLKRLENQRVEVASDIVTLHIREDEVVRTTIDGNLKYALSPKRRRLLLALSATYNATDDLVVKSGYNNATTLRQTLGDLKQKLPSKLKIGFCPIEGGEGRGYRLAEKIRIIEDR